MRHVVSKWCSAAHETNASFTLYKKDAVEKHGKKVYAWGKKYTIMGDVMVTRANHHIVSNFGRAFDDLKEIHEESACLAPHQYVCVCARVCVCVC